jgi:hypothetical protein
MPLRRLGPAVFPLLLYMLAVLQYANTFAYDYAWDDKLVITANDYTKEECAGFATSSRSGWASTRAVPAHPQALHALEYDAFGAAPGGHVAGVVWCDLACVTVYWFVVRHVSRPALRVAGGPLFVVHPLRRWWPASRAVTRSSPALRPVVGHAPVKASGEARRAAGAVSRPGPPVEEQRGNVLPVTWWRGTGPRPGVSGGSGRASWRSWSARRAWWP